MHLSSLFPDKSFMTETKYYPSEVTISIKIASDHRVTNTNILLNISLQCIVKYTFTFYSAKVPLSLITALRQCSFTTDKSPRQTDYARQIKLIDKYFEHFTEL